MQLMEYIHNSLEITQLSEWPRITKHSVYQYLRNIIYGTSLCLSEEGNAKWVSDNRLF